MKFLPLIAVFTTTFVLLPTFIMAGTNDIVIIIAKLESDVVELARTVEGLYANRCTTALNDCSQNNYDVCTSEFPNPSCPRNDELIIDVCDSSCAALFDFTTSSVDLPHDVANGDNGNPTDPQVRTSVASLHS